MDGLTDKITKPLYLFLSKKVFCTLTNGPTDKVSHKLDAHRYREFLQKEKPYTMKNSRENYTLQL